jgi:hypothetical protein
MASPSAENVTPVHTGRVKKPKHTFMLHAKSDDPSEKIGQSLGKYVSTDYRYAALKCASRGFKDILLRKTNSKVIYHYTGDILQLSEPQRVKRGDREIQYSKKPTVKFVNKFVYEELPIANEEEKEQDTAAQEQQATP